MTDPNPVDDPELDDADPSEDPDDTDPTDDPAALTAERDKLRTTLAKMKAERTKLRRDLAAARTASQQEDQPKPDDPAVLADRRARRSGGITALVEAGLTRVQAKQAVRLLDLDSIELDEDGEGDFDDAVADLKEAFPGLFQTGQREQQRQSVRPPAGDSRRARAGAGVDRTTMALLRQAGYR